jgi:carboxypeptidase Taq
MFSKDKNIQKLLETAHELSDISSVGAILAWDQEVYMPVKGGPARAKQMSTMAGIFHHNLINLQIPNVKSTNTYDMALVREMKKLKDKATKIPEKLVKEMSETASLAQQSWQKAKQKKNFGLFVPSLEKILKLKIQAAKLLKSKQQSIYDAMLDEFEPGLTEKQIDVVFSALKPKLIELAKKLKKLTLNADAKIKNQKYDLVAQRNFGLKIASDMGYDQEAGRLDISTHPFTITFSNCDVRITTWENDKDIRPSLFAIIHESGHALYEQGVNPRLDRLQIGEGGGLGGGIGMAMHESQSQLWENIIGRSEWFWKAYYSILKKQFNQLNNVSVDQFTKAVNVVRPSLIRVEADEVTYGLHIMIRYEIEKDLIAGKIKVRDLPKIWNAKYKEYLGVTPKNDAEGVLQDIHWSHGAFGYFPTYLLGTLISAQLWKKMPRTTNLGILREWLRKNIHQHGRVYTTDELLRKITGESLNPKYFLDYLEEKFNHLYSL